MTKISPVAAYLTSSRAVVKKDGNICHFLTPNGCYLGKQVTMKQKNGPTMLLRVIYGEGIRPVYIENMVVNKNVICTSDANPSSPVKIMPYHSMIFRQLVDFFAGKQYLSTKEIKLSNKINQIGVTREHSIPVFENVKNPEYTSRIYDVQENPLTPQEMPYKTSVN